jgi:precorrin-6B C5,15-methyltransferase / cobalt-precorrin-6B C5,C15-methyltransferase
MSAAIATEAARPWLVILGIGEDGPDGLTSPARALLQAAELVIGGARHLALAAPLIHGDHLPWPSPMSSAYPEILARRGRDVVVLASGDPYCYGVGATLANLVPPSETLCIPAPSAFSLACARLGWPLQDTTTISFCGRPLEAILPHLQPGARLLALSADAKTPAATASLLQAHGFGPSIIYILERLGGPQERIRTFTASAASPPDIAPLNMLAIEVVPGPDARILPLSAGLPDDLFDHDGQLTKREIRAITLSALAPCAGELLWDIGAGSGSVAIEWALRGNTTAIAIEARPDRAARAARNALALGATRVELRQGSAPEALTGLPQPHAVFIGGGFQHPRMLESAWTALRPGGRIVANAVSLDSQALLAHAQSTHGGTLTRIAVERLDQIGSMRAMRPAMPVLQWAATKP